MTSKEKSNLVYIIIFVCVAAIGINDSLGITRGAFEPPIFYTSVSGIICFIYFSIAAVRGLYFSLSKKAAPTTLFLVPRAKGAITLCITVTFLVYHFMVYEGPLYTIDTDIFNLITHYIVPIMVILHWLIYDEKGIYQKWDPFFWTLIPLFYFTWANIVALKHQDFPYWDGDFYPYGFMDLTKHPLPSVITTITLLLAFFILLAYLIVFIDTKMNLKKKKNRKKLTT